MANASSEKLRYTEIEEHKSFLGKIGSWISWLYLPMSAKVLRATEKKILSSLKTAYQGWYVDIGPVVGESDKIWTIALNTEARATPILLLHGLGAGVALWCLNLDSLASKRPVYAIDLLGFGRSSRPKFNSDALKAEKEFVQSVEVWRQEMQLDKIVVLGHSFGGFLAASYAMEYPERVSHLILADPWGFPEKPKEALSNISLPIKIIARALEPLNPLWAVRFFGHFGKWLIKTARGDIIRKYSAFEEDENSGNVIAEYIFQCNAQSPTGESAFHSMMHSFGWAKNPMVNRVHKLSPNIPITLIYGARSWVLGTQDPENSPSEIIKQKRPNSYVNVLHIPGAGHHVYADRSEAFNKCVEDACEITDDSQSHKSKSSDSIIA